MSNYKLLALDMDGTTYQKLGDVVPANIEPIIKAQELGVKVVFVTGRPLHAPQNKFVENGFTKHESIAIGYNGALIYDFRENKKILENPIPQSKVKKAFEQSFNYDSKTNVIWGYCVDESVVILNKDIKGTPLEIEKSFFSDRFLNITKDNLNEVKDCYKLLISNCTDEYLGFLENEGFEVAYSKNSNVAEVNLSGINKKFGINFLCNKYGINVSEVIAMGDGKNDISMLEYVGLSLCPKNANEVVKEVVDEVLELSAEDGAVAYVINKYVLGGKNNEN